MPAVAVAAAATAGETMDTGNSGSASIPYRNFHSEGAADGAHPLPPVSGRHEFIRIQLQIRGRACRLFNRPGRRELQVRQLRRRQELLCQQDPAGGGCGGARGEHHQLHQVGLDLHQLRRGSQATSSQTQQAAVEQGKEACDSGGPQLSGSAPVNRRKMSGDHPC